MAKLLFALLLILFSNMSTAFDSQCLNVSTSVTSTSSDEVAQRGCCSHHAGVCGCSGGRAVCCDNSFSPTCGCNQNDIKQFLLENPQETPKT